VAIWFLIASSLHTIRNISEVYCIINQRITIKGQFQIFSPVNIESDTQKRELLKNPPKIEEIQEKKLLTEIEPLQLAF